MNNELKFKIYNKLSKKCFKVTRIDYIDKQVYYYDKDEEETISLDDCILLMPTGICDALDEGMYIDQFKDLLFSTTFSTYKPVKVIGNIFTYKLSKNNSKIKIPIKL